MALTIDSFNAYAVRHTQFEALVLRLAELERVKGPIVRKNPWFGELESLLLAGAIHLHVACEFTKALWPPESSPDRQLLSSVIRAIFPLQLFDACNQVDRQARTRGMPYDNAVMEARIILGRFEEKPEAHWWDISASLDGLSAGRSIAAYWQRRIRPHIKADGIDKFESAIGDLELMTGLVPQIL